MSETMATTSTFGRRQSSTTQLRSDEGCMDGSEEDSHISLQSRMEKLLDQRSMIVSRHLALLEAQHLQVETVHSQFKQQYSVNDNMQPPPSSTILGATAYFKRSVGALDACTEIAAARCKSVKYRLFL